MDRATRKANLKKLQLPSTTGNKPKRKTSQTSRSTATANTAISNYFLTPGKLNNKQGESKNLSPVALKVNSPKKDAPQLDDVNLKTGPRPKRTKLDAFIFQDPNNIPDCVKNGRKSLNNEDLIVSEKKAKKAPKLTTGSKATKRSKSTRAKKQTTIKSAFLRNEQLFAEIAAQHCAADQFDGDDIQLALAISKSEAESKGIRIANENGKDEQVNLINGDTEADLIREKLKKYGFKTAEKKDYHTFAAAFLPKINNRRQKSKWANKFTALTLRSSENQVKKLQGNIEKLLNSQFRPKPLSEHEKFLPNYKLQSILLKNSGVHEENKRIFQTAENINRSNELFFVADLFEINNLPAGHLLKDWTAIQGRDLTPDRKNKKSAKRVKAFENVYQELEQYFNSYKILDWTVEIDQKQDEKINKEVSINKEERNKIETPVSLKSTLNASKILVKIQNVELCKNPDLKERSSSIKEKRNNDKSETILSDSACDKKILQLLPTLKSLDTMQVSSCSNSQNTTNTSQKNRSKSPDIFADSDVEMEEIDKADEVNTEVEAIISVGKDKNYTSSFDEVGDNITTYEIFSSDEVKNTPLSDVIKSAAREPSPDTLEKSRDEKIIDLTQDNLELSSNSKSNDDLNLSKPIVEFDLFAESPLQEEEHVKADISTKAQLSKGVSENQKGETIKFTLSLEKSNNEEQIIENKTEATFKLSPNLRAQEQFKDLLTPEEDEDLILRELAMDESNTSFLNFQGSKQLQTSFHRETATVGKDIIENKLTDNDTIFRQLCNKYLNCKPDNTKIKNFDFDFGENSSQVLSTIQTPQKCDDNLKNLTMDFDITVDNVITLKRKSLSFSVKSPLKYKTKDTAAVLSKSQSFNNNKLNVSIDLTQNDDDDDANVAVEEDDECLVLSDDEINYSIWQANKTLNFQTSLPTDHQDKTDNEFSSDEEDLVSCKENIIEFPNQHDKDKKLSYLDLKDKEKQEKSLRKINLGAEEPMSDFEILTSKYVTSDSPVYFITKPDRSEFGIMEEYSEPFDFTPNLCTPTKVLTEASFLSSPTERTAPMKRFSSCQESSQKFHDLINNIKTTSPSLSLDDTLNGFDEFDSLLNTSPFKTAKSTNKPQGLDKLLTGEISFKESQKTPEKKTDILDSNTHEIEFNNKIYTVRYTCSPKPDYTKYSEAELLKELYKFGIKPLKRKHAVKMLEYIYNQTHPILMEDEDATQQNDVVELDELDLGPCTSKEALKAQKFKSKPNESVFNAPKECKKEKVAANFVQNTNQKLDLQDSCGLEMLRYALDLRADLPDEKYILQTNVTKKTPQPLLPLHIAWYNLVCSNRKLHETILMYEPIDLQEIYLFLKTLGYRYDPKDLKTFFDRRCIIFRYDLTGAAGSNGQAKATNRHVRKSKKAKIAKN